MFIIKFKDGWEEKTSFISHVINYPNYNKIYCWINGDGYIVDVEDIDKIIKSE